MSFELEQMVNELESVLGMWDFFAKRTDLDPENLDQCKQDFGTWVDEDGDEHICCSAAEASVAKMMRVAREAIKQHEAERDNWRHRLENAHRRIDELKEFAGMNDRDLGLYFEEHLRRLEKEEGEENLTYIPPFYWHIMRRLK